MLNTPSDSTVKELQMRFNSNVASELARLVEVIKALEAKIVVLENS